MEFIDQDLNRQELNFTLKIKTNKGDTTPCTDSETQPRTKRSNTIESNGPISLVSSEQIKNNLNINLISNNQTKALKFLTQYKNIYVPKIYLIDYNDTSIYPPKDSVKNESLTQNCNNFKFPFPFLFYNYQNNNSNNEYLNYGYNFSQWKEYANQIKNKLDELNDLVLKEKIRLPEPDNELEYLMALPSDFGGLGNIYHENKYENLKFYDPKLPENKDKQFIEQVKFERNMIWFPLKPNPESLNKKNSPFPQYIELLNQQNTNIKGDINNNGNKAINETKDAINNENNNNTLNDKEKDKIDNNKESNNEEEKNVKYQNKKKEKKDKSESIGRKRKSVRSRSRSRDKSRNRYNSNYRDNSKEQWEKQNNTNWKRYNNYKYKKNNNYNNSYKNYSNKRFSKYKRYGYYKDY